MITRMLISGKVAQNDVEITLATGLRWNLRPWWVIAHRLQTETPWSGETVEDERSACDHPTDGSQDAASALGTGNGCRLHLHGWVLPEPGTRLHVQCFTRGQHLLEDVAIAM